MLQSSMLCRSHRRASQPLSENCDIEPPPQPYQQLSQPLQRTHLNDINRNSSIVNLSNYYQDYDNDFEFDYEFVKQRTTRQEFYVNGDDVDEERNDLYDEYVHDDDYKYETDEINPGENG
eukprot:Awhi_evm1s12781